MQQAPPDRTCPISKIGIAHIIQRISGEDLITGRIVVAIVNTS
jgi:hypothetical protein